MCNSDAVSATELRPHVESLLGALFENIRNGPKNVQKESLTCVACVAEVIDDEFGQYYAHFMPLAKFILQNVNAPDPAVAARFKPLQSKALECIGLIGEAVGKEIFADDAKEMMGYILQSQGDATLSDEVKMHTSMACARICGCLGADFLPYMGAVLPPLLASAALETPLTVSDAAAQCEGEATLGGLETVTMHVRGVGDRQIGINTSAVQEKATAVRVLFAYADHLGGDFFDYVAPVASISLAASGSRGAVARGATAWCGPSRLARVVWAVATRERRAEATLAPGLSPAALTIAASLSPSLSDNRRR